MISINSVYQSKLYGSLMPLNLFQTVLPLNSDAAAIILLPAPLNGSVILHEVVTTQAEQYSLTFYALLSILALSIVLQGIAWRRNTGISTLQNDAEKIPIEGNTIERLNFSAFDFGVCRVDLNRDIVECNEKYLEIMGLSADLSLPMKQNMMWHTSSIYEFNPTTFPATSKVVKANSLNGKSYLLQYYYHSSENHYLFVRTNVEDAFTTQKNLLVNHLRHELSTPVSIIDLQLQQQELSDKNSGQLKDFVTVMRRATERLKLLTQTLNRVNANDVEEVFLPEKDLSQIIEQCIQMVDTNDNPINVPSGQKKIWISKARHSLSTVLLNLIDNAVKHQPHPEKQISISYDLLDTSTLSKSIQGLMSITQTGKPPDQVLKIIVEDNGKAVDADRIGFYGWRLMEQDKTSGELLYNLMSNNSETQSVHRRLSGTDICAELCLRLSGMILYSKSSDHEHGNQFQIIIPQHFL